MAECQDRIQHEARVQAVAGHDDHVGQRRLEHERRRAQNREADERRVPEQSRQAVLAQQQAAMTLTFDPVEILDQLQLQEALPLRVTSRSMTPSVTRSCRRVACSLNW